MGRITRTVTLILAAAAVPAVCLAMLTEESRAAAAAGSARVAPAVFVLKRQIPLLAYPRAIAVGDFDRDGRKDLAVVNSRPATVSILFGLGKGRFGRRHSVAVPENAQAITVANLNPGGRPDLVIGIASYWGDDGSYHPHRVVVRPGRGDGTFEAGRTYGFGYSEEGIGGVAPVVADVNGDSKLDIVSAEGGKLIVLLGKGDGGLRTARAYPLDKYTGAPIISLALGRLNADRRSDAVAGGEWSANEPTGEVSVLLSRIGGGLGAVRTKDTGVLLPVELALADLNHDGRRDLLVAHDRQADYSELPAEYPALSVSLGKGDGSFHAAADYDPTSDPVMALALADFDRDGERDVLLTSMHGMRLLPGSGDGSFRSATQIDETRRAHGAWTAVADFSGDGKPDIAVLGGRARHLDVYLNTTGAAD